MYIYIYDFSGSSFFMTHKVVLCFIGHIFHLAFKETGADFSLQRRSSLAEFHLDANEHKGLLFASTCMALFSKTKQKKHSSSFGPDFFVAHTGLQA